jgi:hypothetical protein
MFLLSKWYLDVVTERGDAAIFYVARLRWGALRLGYAAGFLARAGPPAREAATLRGVTWPRREAGGVEWRNAPLDIRGRWMATAPPIRRVLLTTPEGSIHWTCHMPRARASVQWGGTTLEGTGYAERLRLSIPPWRLPFRTLRWGRHASDLHSLVWIAWSGDDERSWVWLDGEEQSGAAVGDSGVSGLTGDRGLAIRDSRDVRDRRVLATLAAHLPLLVRRAAGPLGRMQEHKRLSQTSLVRGRTSLDRGWTLHELVTW